MVSGFGTDVVVVGGDVVDAGAVVAVDVGSGSVVVVVVVKMAGGSAPIVEVPREPASVQAAASTTATSNPGSFLIAEPRYVSALTCNNETHPMGSSIGPFPGVHHTRKP